ncbi:lateral signaling target protein 2 homolog [Esox lucius]|uniref:lateral signaling target protein 2 homolog n=1 Tax=Esox lucius TaxID=8010 RepID=UPI0014773728|nr:lateral signaling target protein 2 homolog [Esox lucius]
MNECIPDERANRDFYVKFPEEIQLVNLEGQLWFGAECLAAGSIIMNQESESEAMRPLAKDLTRCIEEVRNIARDQALCNRNAYTEHFRQALRKFDNLFADFEFSYVSAMVPVKSLKEYDIQQNVIVLFCETVSRALKQQYITQDMIDDYEPALMFTIPRLAIVSGLIVFPDGPMRLDGEMQDMSELFRPFHSLLKKIRNLLLTLKEEELYLLERNLCDNQNEGFVARRRTSAILHSAITQQLEHGMHANHVAKSKPCLPHRASVLLEKHKKGENASLLHVEPGCLELEQEVKMSSSRQSDIREIEQLSMMFYQAGNEMSSFLSPASSQTSSPCPQRRGSASLSPSPMASPLRHCRPQNRLSSGWSGVCSSVDEKECFFHIDDLDRTQERSSSYENSAHPKMPCPYSKQSSLSRKCVEANLQRSKNWPCRSKLSTPGALLSHNVTQDMLETADIMIGIQVSNPQSPKLSTWTEKVEEEVKEEKDDDSGDSDLQSLNDIATFCKLSPCICFQCPSASPFEPDNTHSCLTPQSQVPAQDTCRHCSPPISVIGGLAEKAFSPREQGKERGHVLCPQNSSLWARGEQSEGVPLSVTNHPMPVRRISGDGEAEHRVVKTDSEYTLSHSSYLINSNNMELINHPDIQLACHNIRSRFNSSGDLLHRLFVCISGVADQLQSNYSSELRTILKKLFEIMTTKTVLVKEDKQRKASVGLNDMAIEDCALCMEWLSSSLPMEQDVQCEELPAWVPDEACSFCTACNAPFTIIRKKHHCRSCGKIFCSRCSPRSVPLPRYGQVKAVRVCTHCYMFHVTPFYPRNGN